VEIFLIDQMMIIYLHLIFVQYHITMESKVIEK